MLTWLFLDDGSESLYPEINETTKPNFQKLRILNFDQVPHHIRVLEGEGEEDQNNDLTYDTEDLSQKYGCQADKKLCSSEGGYCTSEGLCMCKLYYLEDDCSKKSDSRVEMVQGELTQGGVAGIVIAWIFVPLILYGLGMFLISKL